MVVRHHLQRKSHGRLTALFALVTILAASFGATTWSQALYIVTGVEEAAIVLDGSQEAPDLGSRIGCCSSFATDLDDLSCNDRRFASVDVCIRCRCSR